MYDTALAIESNPFAGSAIGMFSREILKWRTQTTETVLQDQNQLPKRKPGQLTDSAIDETEPVVEIGHEPAAPVAAAYSGNYSYSRRYYRSEKRRCLDYVKTLKKAATLAGKETAAHHLPYRFFFFKKNGDVFLDLIKLNDSGKPVNTITRNITDLDFDTVIDDVREGKGLYLDSSL